MFKYLNRGISTPIAITIIVILAVVFVSGVLAYQYYWAPEEKITEETPVETPADETPAETPADETADWQTYRNEEYGFEFKYPKNWYIVDDDCSNKDYLFFSVGISDKETLSQYECSYLAIDIINENWRIGTRNFKDIKIGQIDGQMDSLTCSDGCLILDKNHNNFVIRVSKNPLEDKTTKKILSTFKFTK